MKTAWKYTAAVAVIGGSLVAGSLLNLKAEGAGVTPGGSDDPVVTKSYVDAAIQQALKGGGAPATPAAPPAPTTPNAPAPSPAPASGGTADRSADGLKIVTVKPGQLLIAGAGTEFVVRAGKAVIYSPDTNGVADLTDGVEITNGGAVANNHLLSFPRDGRGIQVVDGNTYSLTVMVRGAYSIR